MAKCYEARSSALLNYLVGGPEAERFSGRIDNQFERQPRYPKKPMNSRRPTCSSKPRAAFLLPRATLGSATNLALDVRTVQSRRFEPASATSASPRFQTYCCPRSKRRLGPTAEVTKVHSITTSALSNSLCGMLMSSAFAVFRLMASLKRVGCSTGRSAGLAPFSILST